jgi:hypothetical protein
MPNKLGLEANMRRNRETFSARTSWFKFSPSLMIDELSSAILSPGGPGMGIVGRASRRRGLVHQSLVQLFLFLK